MICKKILSFLIIIFVIIYLVRIGLGIKGLNNNERCIYIPAVSGDKGLVTEFCLRTIKGSGKVFIDVPNVFSSNYQSSFVIAKLSACKLSDICNLYDYLFYTKSRFNGEGFSGTAGLSALVLYSLYTSKHKLPNVSITGFILPNGLIFPVSGIQKKLEASIAKNLVLVAPSNYSNDIIQAYTILDIKNILLNDSKKYHFEIPREYYRVLREVALDICNEILDTEIKKFIDNGSFYTAASLCFIKKIEKNKTINLSENDLEKEINDFERLVIEHKCKTYTCEELKFQVLLRINMSKNITEIYKKYWRYYTAKGWYKMLKELENIERLNNCKIIDEDYEIMADTFNNKISYEISCFEKREILSKLYYELLLNYDFDINIFLNSVENYLNYLYSKNGFSVTSYNYFTYGKDLINMGKVSDGILYIIYAINYAI